MGQLDSIGQLPVLWIFGLSCSGLLTIHIHVVFSHELAKLGEPTRSIDLLHVECQGVVESMQAAEGKRCERSGLLEVKRRSGPYSWSRRHELKGFRWQGRQWPKVSHE